MVSKHRLSSNRIGDDGATFIADLVLTLPRLETITFVTLVFPFKLATENFIQFTQHDAKVQA
jgi:hypothetical protein